MTQPAPVFIAKHITCVAIETIADAILIAVLVLIERFHSGVSQPIGSLHINAARRLPLQRSPGGTYQHVIFAHIVAGEQITDLEVAPEF